MKKEQTPIYKLVGERIKKFRISKDFTQQDLADKCGINRSSVVFIEKGVQKLSIKRLYIFAYWLNTNIYDLLPSIENLPSDIFNQLDEGNFDEYSKKLFLSKERKEILDSLEQAKKIDGTKL